MRQRSLNTSKKNAENTVRRRLSSRTLGLLEVTSSGNVTYLHRTIQEWISRPEVWDNINRNTPSDFHPNLELFKEETVLLPYSIRMSTDPLHDVGQCFYHAAMIQKTAGVEERVTEIWKRLVTSAVRLCSTLHRSDVDERFSELHAPGICFRHICESANTIGHACCFLWMESLVHPYHF
jgi:hypothetical protein